MPTLAPTFDLATFAPSAVGASAVVQGNLKSLHTLLRQVQQAVGAPLVLSSTYRTEADNARVGGVKTSQHLTGSAADFVVPSLPLPTVAERIGAALSRGDFVVGQVIFYPSEVDPGENKNHVHISLPNGSHRNQELVKVPTGYAALSGAAWPAIAAATGAGLLLVLLVVVLVGLAKEGGA